MMAVTLPPRNRHNLDVLGDPKPTAPSMTSDPLDTLEAAPALSAPVEAWLVEGGDDRIILDPETGLNRYGCGLRPDDGLTAFGSSTASTISPAGFAAAEARRALFEGYGSREAAWIAGSADLKARLASLCGLRDGERIVLAASGTDVLRVAADHARRRAPGGLSVILPEPCETGRGAPAALCRDSGLITVAMRERDGRPRPTSAIDADVEAEVAAALERADAHVLLCLLDVSKTGLIAPSAACAERLAARDAGRLTVLVDACQFRLSPRALRGYLDRGIAVAITGSKFLAGPAFSGALLLPEGFPDADTIPEPPSLGLLLRWEAAVAELAVFQRNDSAVIAGLIRRFGEAISQAIDANDALERMAAPPLTRFGGDGWDDLPTIFSFLPRREGRPLAAAETQALFSRLQGTRLGQPVPVGIRDGAPVSVLRLSLSARQIAIALNRPSGPDRLIDQALAALERTARQAA
jgi:hypothetical protein